MSNPDLPGPYWQDEAGYAAQRRGGPQGSQPDDSPWDNERFWRDDRRVEQAPVRAERPRGRDSGRDSGRSRHSGQQYQDVPPDSRGTRRASRGDDSWPDMLAGKSRRAAAQDDWDAADRGGRFSHTADDLRNRLGLRGSAAGRGRRGSAGSAGRGPVTPQEQPDEAFWSDSERRPSRLSSGRAAAETMTNAFRSRTGQDRAAARNGAGPGGPGADGSGSRRRVADRAGRRGPAAFGPEFGANGAGDYDDGRGGYNGNGRAGNGYGAGDRYGAGYNGNGRDGNGRNGTAGNGNGRNGTAGNGNGRNGNGSGYRGNGEGYGRGSNGYGDGNNGNGYDYGDQPGGRTALRERLRDGWDGERAGRRGQRARLADPNLQPGRPGGGGGSGPGGGRGGGRGGDGDGVPRTGGERFKQWLLYGSWWRRWTWKKALGVLGCGIAACLLFGVLGFFLVYEMTPIPAAGAAAASWQSSSIYFSDGKLIGNVTNNQGINRQILATADIPADMNQAMIAAEDRNYYHEGGISITGIARSAFEDIFGSGGLQGGSTITEEYAKNYYQEIGDSRSASTKIKEIFISVKLAHQKSKPWILTQYLNTVPFGPTIYGVGAASQFYFGVNLASHKATLTIPQAAMLAAMPNEPGVFNPSPSAGTDYTSLVARWQYVLTNMARDGAITQQQAATYCASCSLSQAEASFNKYVKIKTDQNTSGYSGYDGYIMNSVEQELLTTYGITKADLGTGGYHVVTTINQRMQSELYKTVGQVKAKIATLASEGDGQKLPSWAHIGALLEQPGTGKVLAMYGGPGMSISQAKCAKLLCDDNMATQARNQVGSSFKPYVLAQAVKENMNTKTSELDGFESICSPDDQFPQMPSVTVKGTGNTACPSTPYGWYNFESIGESNGPVSPTTASALSLNTAYGDLIHRVGTQNVIDIARDFGVNTGDYPNGSDLQHMVGQSGIALGAASLTVEEQATFFASLANSGEYVTPHFVAEITNKNNQKVPLKIIHRQVLTPTQAADVDYALSQDTVYGTAYPNGVLSPFRPTIGKTGTTNVAQDAFFIGAIPQYSLAVGMFTTEQNQSPSSSQTLNILPNINGQQGGYGGAWPTYLWQQYMTNEFQNVPVAQLPTPDFTGFDKWTQAQAAKKAKPTCKFGQFQNCRCPQGQQCGNPNPNPNPSCGPGTGQFCGGPSPSVSPSPSCGPGTGQACGPSPSPSTSCIGLPPACNPAHTDATLNVTSAGTTATLLSATIQPAEEQQLWKVIDRIRADAVSRGG